MSTGFTKDKRRNNAPDNTFRPDGMIEKPCEIHSFDAMRTVFAHVQKPVQSAGSAYLECGHTKIMCSIYGPRHQFNKNSNYTSESALLQCDIQYAACADAEQRRRGGQNREQEKIEAMLIQKALEPALMLETLPYAVIDVQFLVIENDGNVIPCAINCASLALMASGVVPMRDIVTASGLCLRQSNSQVDFIMDEAYSERRIRHEKNASADENDGNLWLSAMSSTDQVTQMHMSSGAKLDCNENILTEAMKWAMEGCVQMRQILRDAMIRSHS